MAKISDLLVNSVWHMYTVPREKSLSMLGDKTNSIHVYVQVYSKVFFTLNAKQWPPFHIILYPDACSSIENTLLI